MSLKIFAKFLERFNTMFSKHTFLKDALAAFYYFIIGYLMSRTGNKTTGDWQVKFNHLDEFLK